LVGVDEFRGRMLRGGRGESGGGGGGALVSWGDGGKCDEGTETRTGLIFIMRLQQLPEHCSPVLLCCLIKSRLHTLEVVSH